MNTAFTSGLCSSLSPVQRRILNASSNVKKTALSIRNSTVNLPVEISIMIAVNAIVNACSDMHAKIFEIAVLLFIRFNRKDFVVKRNKSGLEIIKYTPRNTCDWSGAYREFLIDGVPDGWLAYAVEEIITSPMWKEIVPYIDDVNVVKTILHQQNFLMDTWFLTEILVFIAPSSIAQLISLEDLNLYSLDTELTEDKMLYNSLRHYIEQFQFNIKFNED